MKTRTILILLLFLGADKAAFAQTFDYISPKDHSLLVSLSTNIILKTDKNMDPASLTPSEFSVTGSVSGVHEGTVKLSDDNKTILFHPLLPFLPGEDVVARVLQGMKTSDGGSLPSVSFRFTMTSLAHPMVVSTDLQSEISTVMSTGNPASAYGSLHKIALTDSVHSDFPQITVGTSNTPAPGNIFITNLAQNTNTTIGSYLMILDNNGAVVKSKPLPESATLFKMEPNGELTYDLKPGGQWVNLDTSLTPIDTFNCGNGYLADAHDFLLLPNGHAVLFAYDPEPVDMSEIVPGGNPGASVIGLVVQELDASKNVVFQWRTWDYLPITDSYADLTAQSVDLIHANALEVDRDGNILVSMRHLSSIVKINRQTGEIMWIFGGKQNEFTFINEHESNSPTYFSYQHNVSMLPNGNLTLFDNGNQHSPNYSRGVEYKMDEQNKSATLVWEYRHTPDIYNFATGSVERLPNGNTLVDWGIAAAGTGVPICTEVHPDNSIALELFLPPGQFSYRSYKYQWTSQTPKANVTLEILPGNSYSFNSPLDTTGIKIKFRSLSSPLYAEAKVISYQFAPVTPVFNTDAPLMFPYYFDIKGLGFSSYTGDVSVDLREYPALTNPKETIIYARSKTDSSFIPMPTSYDSTKNELTCTTSTLGDFAFGVPQTIRSVYSPVPFSPKDSEIVNEDVPVKFTWGTIGIVQTYHLQVSSDASFKNIVVDNSSLRSTSYSFSSVSSNTTYYWRINNSNTAGTSTWSNTESFRAGAPFINLLSPNRGEQIYVDSVYIIRWESNITDTISIELLNGNKPVTVIGTSSASGTKAFKWHLLSDISPDSNYEILLVSKNNTGVSSVSRYPFTITASVAGVHETSGTSQRYTLFQNYPNPFNPTTSISFSIAFKSFVSVKVFDELGREVAILVDGELPAGNYTRQWNAANMASGIYFYRLQAGTFSQTRKLLYLR